MSPWVTIQGIAAPLGIPNVNTDDIYPGPAASPVLRKLPLGAGTEPESAGNNAFAAWRLHPDGTKNPDFILNRSPFDRAQIIIGGMNFGCGSSRELAVWALQGIHIACVVAPSFGEIFYDNCIKNRLLPALVDQPTQAKLLEFVKSPSGPVLTVDLNACCIQAAGDSFPFVIADYSRRLLLDGVDEINAALADMSSLDRFELNYSARRPWLAPK